MPPHHNSNMTGSPGASKGSPSSSQTNSLTANLFLNTLPPHLRGSPLPSGPRLSPEEQREFLASILSEAMSVIDGCDNDDEDEGTANTARYSRERTQWETRVDPLAGFTGEALECWCNILTRSIMAGYYVNLRKSSSCYCLNQLPSEGTIRVTLNFQISKESLKMKVRSGFVPLISVYDSLHFALK
jgi:hypothetical protein